MYVYHSKLSLQTFNKFLIFMEIQYIFTQFFIQRTNNNQDIFFHIQIKDIKYFL